MSGRSFDEGKDEFSQVVITFSYHAAGRRKLMFRIKGSIQRPIVAEGAP